MSIRTRTTAPSTPELRMLWYPQLRGSALSQEVMDGALRQGRRERAEMLAAIASGVSRSVRRVAWAIVKGLSRMQERRAGACLSRALNPPGVCGHVAGARGEMPGPVCQLLSHPESLRDAHESAAQRSATPRLAA